jgi:putative flavoprotein involved in K+ transport
MNRLPGDADADLDHPLDGFIDNVALVARLESYRERWDLPVREGATVMRVEPASDGPGYRVHVDGVPGELIDCRSVVVASGIQNVPRIPPIATSLPGTLTQIPALTYRQPDQLAPGAVLVVGGGQTGGQIVEDLLAAGRKVYWSVSRVTRLPRRYRGRDILDWLATMGFFEATTEAVTDPVVRAAAMPIISGVGRYGHTLSLQWLESRGARLIGRITGVAGEALLLDDSVAECIRFADARSAEVCRQIDDAAQARGEALPPHELDAADVPHADPDSVSTPSRLSLDSASITTVIWATGVTGDFSYLPDEATTAAGEPAHDKGVSPLAGLYFVGLPWLTHRGSGIVHGIASDAGSIAGRVAERAAA